MAAPLVLVCPRCLGEIEVVPEVDHLYVVGPGEARFRVRASLRHECR
jgi:hypothetical protein